MRFALSKVDLAMFFMAPTWPPKEAYADDASDRCHVRAMSACAPIEDVSPQRGRRRKGPTTDFTQRSK
jgi:hypothetical protein